MNLLLLAILPALSITQDLSEFYREDWDTTSGYKPPSGRYRVAIPSGMETQTDPSNPDMVLLSGESRGVAMSILIKRVKVTPGAASSQLMLTTRDNHLKKLPNFTVLQTRKVKIADRTCMVMTGQYDYQANKAHQQVIEQAYVVDGSDGFVIHIEVPAYAYGDIQDRVREIYQSFRPLSTTSKAPPPPPELVLPPGAPPPAKTP